MLGGVLFDGGLIISPLISPTAYNNYWNYQEIVSVDRLNVLWMTLNLWL
jgi:hypothetical protein